MSSLNYYMLVGRSVIVEVFCIVIDLYEWLLIFVCWNQTSLHIKTMTPTNNDLSFFLIHVSDRHYEKISAGLDSTGNFIGFGEQSNPC